MNKIEGNYNGLAYANAKLDTPTYNFLVFIYIYVLRLLAQDLSLIQLGYN